MSTMEMKRAQAAFDKYMDAKGVTYYAITQGLDTGTAERVLADKWFWHCQTYAQTGQKYAHPVALRMYTRHRSEYLSF